MITAVKPVYDRKTCTFSPEVVRPASPLLAHDGYLVFDDPGRALDGIKNGSLLGHWTSRKRACVIQFLEKEAA